MPEAPPRVDPVGVEVPVAEGDALRVLNGAVLAREVGIGGGVLDPPRVGGRQAARGVSVTEQDGGKA